MNEQPIEKQTYRADGRLDVVNVWPTIQGEGPYCGRPAVFVRLAGCNINCPGCDTDYTTGRNLFEVREIVHAVRELMKGCLVVLTGGEPFRQNIAPLVERLRDYDYLVQVETNGTLPPPPDGFHLWSWSEVTIVCSPKTGKIHPHLPIDYYKYVVHADEIDPEDGLPTHVLDRNNRPARPRPKDKNIPIYIQPMDMGKGRDKETIRNLEAARDVVLKHNYVLCLQLHKLIGLD